MADRKKGPRRVSILETPSEKTPFVRVTDKANDSSGDEYDDDDDMLGSDYFDALSGRGSDSVRPRPRSCFYSLIPINIHLSLCLLTRIHLVHQLHGHEW